MKVVKTSIWSLCLHMEQEREILDIKRCFSQAAAKRDIILRVYG